MMLTGKLAKSAVAAACLCLTLVLGCGHTLYTITTTGGKQYIATEKPKFDGDSKTYTFKDADGNLITVNQSDISEIKTHD